MGVLMYFFKRLAMGLSNSAQTFQRVVEHVLNGLEGVFVYLDDIMVFSEEATHDLKLEAIFKHLEDAGLSISLNKCKFLKKKIDYLRYEVSEAGIRPLSKKVEAIKKFPIPTKQKELLHYLGAINYFRASLGQLSTEDGGKPKSVAEILMPLYSLGTCNIAKGTSITDIWKHSPKIRKAVEESKRLLTKSGINFTVTQFTVTEIILQLPKKFYSYRKKFTVTEKILQLLVGVCINPNLKRT